MRSVRFPLLVLASLLAVVLGVGAAFVGTRDKGEPGQSAATAPTTSASATQDAAVETGGSAKGATTSNGGGGTSAGGAAKAAAAVFLRDLGMRDPVAATYRATGDVTAEVGIHPRAGESGRPLDKVTTLVQLRRYTGGWVVTGARASNAIEVAEPLAFARVLSPLTVSGLSNAYEGTVHVTVTEDRRGADRVLGKGFVNGGATELAPFRGPISFQRPAGDAGWVVFSGDTGADTGIMSATAVRIRFGAATAAPRIRGVRTTPAPIGSANVVMLTGSGTLTVRVDAINARDVRFLLVPSGTGNRPNAKLLGVDSDGGNGWTLSWRYPDESFMGHLLVQVNGSGGTAEHDRIGVQHA
jgi:hypothetical protein